MKDPLDMLDSFKLLLEVKKEPPRKQEEKPQETSNFSIRVPQSVQQKVKKEEEKKPEPKPTLIKPIEQAPQQVIQPVVDQRRAATEEEA